jgi:hypothetical protein
MDACMMMQFRVKAPGRQWKGTTFMRVRFSIAGLMAVVFIFAVGFAGLRAGSVLWASAVFTIAVALLAAAILGSVVCRGRARMAWVGFAVFGWTYMVATFVLWSDSNGVTGPPFVTKVLLDYFQPTNNATVITIDRGPTGEQTIREYVPSLGMRPGTMIPAGPPPGVRVVNLHHYRRIGHSLAAIVFGVAGAVLGVLFSARAETTHGQRPSREEKARE